MSRILDVNLAQSDVPQEVRQTERRRLQSAINSVHPFIVDTEGYTALTVAFTNRTNPSQIIVRGSDDGVNWGAIRLIPHGRPHETNYAFYIDQTYEQSVYSLPKTLRYIRFAEALSVGIPTFVSVELHNRPVIGVQSTQDISSDLAWQYTAAAGGITNTSAVTILAANTGTHLLPALSSLDILNSGATDTEVTIRCATTTATVLWRGIIKAGTSFSTRFSPYRKGIATEGLQAICSAASTVSINATGLFILR